MRSNFERASFKTCIYCGDAAEGRTKEHVVPEGLGGKAYLKGASCRKCQDVTSLIERNALREVLGFMRRKENYPTKRKHDRSSQTVFAGNGFSITPRQVPIDRVPYMVAVPVFPLTPCSISGANFSLSESIKWIMCTGRHHYRDFSALSAQSVDYEVRMADATWVSLLLKIAYCFAIATPEIGEVEYIAPRFIRKFDIEAFRYIASHPYLIPSQTVLPHAYVWVDKNYVPHPVRVLISLFPSNYGPLYDIHVGYSYDTVRFQKQPEDYFWPWNGRPSDLPGLYQVRLGGALTDEQRRAMAGCINPWKFEDQHEVKKSIMVTAQAAI